MSSDSEDKIQEALKGVKTNIDSFNQKAKEIGEIVIENINPEHPVDFLENLEPPFGKIVECISNILYDPESGIGVINEEISINKASFSNEGMVLCSRALGHVDTDCEILIPNYAWERDSIIAKKMGCVSSSKHFMEFKFDKKGIEKRCFYDLFIQYVGEKYRHHFTSGNCDIVDPKKFYRILKDIGYVMLGMQYSRFSQGALIGIISKKGEYFLRPDYHNLIK